MTATQPLLKITGKTKVAAAPPAVQPVVDRFFLVAVISGILGTVGMGGYLWLVRTGRIPGSVNYQLIRELHIWIQLYLFFGVALCGFIIQAAPRILNIGPPLSLALTSVVLSAPFLGVLTKALGLPELLSAALLALGPLGTCALLVLRQKRLALRAHSLFIMSALLALGGSAFVNFAAPQNSFLVFCLAIGGALLGTSHIFIANLLGGRHLGQKVLYFCLAAFHGSALLMVRGHPTQGIFLGLICSLFYVLRTGLFTASSGPALVRLGFKFGYFWCLVGWGLLVNNPAGWDQALHVLATGWGVTILFAMSLHITGFISSFSGNDRALNSAALIIWQVIPVTRGLVPLQSAVAAVVAVVVAFLVLTVWLHSLWRRRYRRS